MSVEPMHITLSQGIPVILPSQLGGQIIHSEAARQQTPCRDSPDAPNSWHSVGGVSDERDIVAPLRRFDAVSVPDHLRGDPPLLSPREESHCVTFALTI